ncbi:MAG: aminodeoxychorismate synthase component I [Candidatus Sedimenticola sp. 20ELBAFRAG]
MPLIQDLPYFQDSARIFEAVADKPWSVFLDSGRPFSRQGRFDIITFDPYMTLETRGNDTELVYRDGQTTSALDPFSLVQQALGEVVPSDPCLPFVGGALGFFGYDLAHRLEDFASTAPVESALPDMAVGVYDWALVVDHDSRKSCLVGQGRDDRTAANWDTLVELFSSEPALNESLAFSCKGAVESNLSKAQYTEAFNAIQRYIRDGDCYQVNFSQRFSAGFGGHPWAAFKAMRKTNPAPFSAYINNPAGQVLSSSPERFLQVREGRVETKPIKGTRPRSTNPVTDARAIRDLQQSVKDRAENLMIVDLLRNDLGKSCVPGSIHVPKLFEVESFATVHHLVSTICGELTADKTSVDLLRGAFPGGSITGAPKLRAMEIIEELEPSRRGVYCGSIGYIGFDGSMDTNIAIRTLVHQKDQVTYSAGGGIVADSDCEAEYQETFDKARAVLDLLQG